MLKQLNYMTLNLQVILVLACLASSCGAPTKQLESTQSAYVTQDQLSLISQTVKNIDYIYFDPTVGICFARSFYISLELAALKIATSAQYISGEFYPRPENEWLSKVEKAEDWEKKWAFHVTPLVVLNLQNSPTEEHDDFAPVMKGNTSELTEQLQEQENEPLIIDPSLFNEPVKRSHWFRTLNSVGDSQLNLLPGSNPFASLPSQLEVYKDIKMPQNFSEMSKFTLQDIYYACRVIRSETSKKSTKATLRLLERTKQLIEILSGPDFNKIDDSQEVPQQEFRECMDTWGLL